MDKKTTRPLLVNEATRLKNLEIAAAGAVQALRPDWPEARKAQAEFEAVRTQRVQAELQLWLADCQWDREVVK